MTTFVFLDASMESLLLCLGATDGQTTLVLKGTLQTRAMPSRLAETKRLPSGDQATLSAGLPGTLQVKMSLPVLPSHTCAVPSRLAEASSLPPGDQATLITRLL